MLHYLESNAQEDIAMEALREKYIPLKLAYAGSSGATHIRLANSEPYRDTNWKVNSEVALLEQVLRPSEYRLIEFGPGNGKHTADLIRGLYKTYAIKSYTGVDFSRTLFTAALLNIRTVIDPRFIDFQCIDLERPFGYAPFPANGGEPLFLMLGGLLGNVENPKETAANIYRSLPSGGRVLISVTSFSPGNSDREHIQPYQNQTFHDAVLEPLKAMGIQQDDVELEIKWNSEIRAVVGQVHIRMPIVVNNVNRLVRLQIGDVIRVFISRRFEIPSISVILTAAGFQIEAASEGARLDLIVTKGI